MGPFAYQIQDAENSLTRLKRNYLRRFGWESTCNTPGAYWMWTRDFADVDASRMKWNEDHPNAGKNRPYGRVMATEDLAVAMTKAVLDEQLESMSDVDD